MLPNITCCLTDKNGTILNPISPGAITYTQQKNTLLNSPSKYTSSKSCNEYHFHRVSVCIQGYVSLFFQGKTFSPPIEFCITRELLLPEGKNTLQYFWTTNFCCHIIPIYFGNKKVIEKAKIFIDICSSVMSCHNILLKLPPTNQPVTESMAEYIYAEKVIRMAEFESDTVVEYNRILNADTHFYVARANGIKNEYKNEDALPEYLSGNILALEDISYCHLFVNGVLQPKCNYDIQEGILRFNTLDVPPDNSFIVIKFVTFKDDLGNVFPAETYYYVARSNGTQRLFTNADSIPIYTNNGIPSLSAVSFHSFYINGVLQPKINYEIHDGEIEILSQDVPNNGVLLMLESIILKNTNNMLIPAEIEQYNAYSSGNKVYTNFNEIPMYGTVGISDPENTSYQHLLVNGLIQPPINYSVQQGVITLDTLTAPIENAPLILQSVVFLSS
ncbi:MAG: DUF4183 domain-containing protein [Aminipila sp.]